MVRQLTTSFGAYQIVKGRSIANSNASPNLLMGNKLILLVILFLLVSLFAGFFIFWFLCRLVLYRLPSRILTRNLGPLNAVHSRGQAAQSV